MRRPGPRRRTPASGFTLIEVVVALGIMSILFGAAVMGLGALTGTKAKGATNELAGVMRSLYDTAALSGKTCRLVFELPNVEKGEKGPAKYWAECAKSAVTAAQKRAPLKTKPEERRKEEHNLQDFMAQEKERIETQGAFSQFQSPEIAPRALPSSVKLSVWTRHQREAADTGISYLYFFPQGYTEKAMVYIRQGDNVWTLSLAPLTGKTSVVAGELEIPRA